MSAKHEAVRIIEMWRRWRERNGSIISQKSIMAFGNAFVTFIEWMQNNRYSISSMNREKWIAYCNYVSLRTDFAVEYRRLKIYVAKIIIDFLFDTNAIEEFDTSQSKRSRMNIAGNNSPLPLLPVYKDIQELRRTVLRLEHAMAFEFALSSGLRNSELRSVRLCDINFDKLAIDKSTNAPSIYCGATVTVSTMVASTKGKRDRVTHIGNLAARLVKMYARVNGVKLSSQVPLILNEQRLTNVIDSINDSIPWSHSINKGVSKERTVIPSDIDDEFFNLPRVMQRSYLARVEKEKKATHKPSGRVEGSRITCHALRYFFSSLMLHRTYSGHRNAIERVAKLMGHSSPLVTMRYACNLNLVESDSDWVNTLDGTSSSWLNVMINKVSESPRKARRLNGVN